MKSHKVVYCFLTYYPILFQEKMSVGARVTTTMRDLNHIKDWHDVTKVTLSCIESSTTAFEFLKVLLFIHCRSFKTTSR